MNWTSLHIFYFDNNKELLVKCIYNMYLNNFFDKFFYINYWDGGPHIRLRIANITKNEKEIIIKTIQKFIQENPSLSKISEKDYLITSNNFADKENSEILELQKNNTILEIEYKPEIDKYLNNEGVHISEDIFFISSLNSLTYLKNSPNKEMVYMHSLQFANYILKYFLNTKQTVLFLKEYERYWHSFSNSDIKSTKLIRIPHKKFAEFDDPFSKIKANFTHSEQMGFIFNYIHLTNNRLGIKPFEEAILSSILTKFWGDEYENKSNK
uniref:TclL n=1 Tax=Macrococcoides caseolyticum TaxID=69966 RepID=A0A097PTA3_9STAP|nr:lantibiotic dehydratase C-terminal domain-containing protein [Macrococcus caseolyticus]AIU53947.1 TclL [Macrococcus caseolyticus]